MRRCLLSLALLAPVALLAGCGNKGPLVRPAAAPARSAPMVPAPAASSAPMAVPLPAGGAVDNG